MRLQVKIPRNSTYMYSETPLDIKKNYIDIDIWSS